MHFNIEQFTYSKSTKRLLTEASTLGLSVGKLPKEIIVRGKTQSVCFELHHIQTSPVDTMIYKPHSSWEGNPIGEIVLFVFNT